MRYENYLSLFKDEGYSKTLRSKKNTTDVTFKLDKKPDTEYKLFTVGITEQFHPWKTEESSVQEYTAIHDAFDTEHAVNAQYSLSFSQKQKANYVKRALKKLHWPPNFAGFSFVPLGSQWDAGIFVTAKDLSIDKANGGYLHFTIEVRFNNDNANSGTYAAKADLVYTIDIPEGTYPMTELKKHITIPESSTACVNVWLEGVGYSGEVYFEKPYINNFEGWNALPEFAPNVSEREEYVWLGQNLSRKEWPEFRISLNGTVIFEGEVFERCHLDSEFSVKLPWNLLKEENTVTYQLISDYHDPLPYSIHEIGIIEKPDSDFEIVSLSQYGKLDGEAFALVKTKNENCQVALDFPDEYIKAEKEFLFKEKGLHGIRFCLLKSGKDIPVTFKAEGMTKTLTINEVFDSLPDTVITGTGDAVYINQNLDDFEEYLAWYFANHIGNFVTIRPVYRWTGTRVINPAVWKMFTRVMNECGIKYVLLMDGREPVGLCCNPSREMLEGEGFLGFQEHEMDGRFLYWIVSNYKKTVEREQKFDLFMRSYEDYPEYCADIYDPKLYLKHSGKNSYVFRNLAIPRDMKIGYEETVKELNRLLTNSNRLSRHTGPAVAFKCFLDAGFKWVGAETMDSNMEVLMCFLRGVKKAYNLKAVGVHHALQWSTEPHDVPEHYRRYLLALYTSYMLGADDINTEEGLWRMEAYGSKFHRFSDACLEHLKVQQDFYKYTIMNERKGKFYTPLAFLHGRYDGWVAFGLNNVWGWAATEGLQNGLQTDAEKSWKLLRVAYPQTDPGEMTFYRNCPTDRPLGCYSATPYGQVDVIPLEKSQEIAKDYKTLVFAGYNYYDGTDFNAVEDFVKSGGRLILTRAHLTTTTNYEDVKNYNLTFAESPLSFIKGEPVFVTDTVNGVEIEVITNEATCRRDILLTTDSGRPLLSKYYFGDGEVLLFETKAYPAHPAIAAAYEKVLKDEVQTLSLNEYAYAECDDTVEFSVYDTDDERHIYLIAVDWYNDPKAERSAVIRIGDQRHTIKLSFGEMVKCVIRDDKLTVIREKGDSKC